MTEPAIRLILIVCLGLPVLVFSQPRKAFMDRTLASNDITLRMPPLDTLLKAAEQFSPLLKEHDVNVALAKLEEQAKRREWTRHLGTNIGWSYGQFDALTVNPDAPVGVATTTTSQNRYTLGAYFKMPLFAVINRGNEIQQTKLKQEQAMYRREAQAIELRQAVIRQYQSVVQAHRLLFITNNNLQTFKLQIERAEREFVDGIIPVTEYSRLYDMYMRATEAFETRKTEFLTAYLILEEITGVKLNL